MFRWGCKIHYLSSFWVGGVTRCMFVLYSYEYYKFASFIVVVGSSRKTLQVKSSVSPFPVPSYRISSLDRSSTSVEYF